MRRKRSDSPNKSPPHAAEIDGAVHVAAHRTLRVGEIATVTIERADAYGLRGTMAGV